MTKAAKKLIMSLLAACLLFSGCANGSSGDELAAEDLPPEAGTINGSEVVEKQASDNVFSLNFDPEAGTNPVRANSSANMQFWSLLYDSVFTVDGDFQVSSDVVTEVKSDDYIWWVFNINTDILFSDGTPLTAKDVVYSIQRAQQTEYYRERLSCVYGISALDDGCFAITTAYANSQFPALLNIPVIKKDDYFEDWPVGSGPYMLNEDHTALVLNPESRHAAEMPISVIYLKNFMDTTARITAFEDAGIDIVTNDPTGMYNLGYGSSNETRYYDTSNMHFLGFNMKGMFFQFFRTRYAMEFAVDRDYVVDELMNGCGVTAALPVHPKSALYDEEYAENFGYDLDKSAAFWEAAGVGDLDSDGALEIMVTGIIVELKIKFIVNNDSTVKVAAARKIAEDLNAIGITTTLYELSWDDYIEALETGDYDMYYGEVRLGPDWDLSYLFRIRSDKEKKSEQFIGKNYAGCEDSEYCELYSAYLAAPEGERYDAFQEVCKYLSESAAIVPICFERREVLTHRGVVSGISPTQYDLFNHFSEWTINLS